MGSHTLRLEFDGLGAARHEMPTALEKQITAGAQEFLGAHAYYFTTGRVPINVNDHNQYFQIKDIRISNGSWVATFICIIAYDLLKKYYSHLSDEVTSEAARFTKTAFKKLITMSYAAWQQHKPISEMHFNRIEPVFSDLTGNHAPIIDLSAEDGVQRRLLFERTNSSMTKMTAPIGRAATHLNMWFDNVHLDCIKEKYTEADISSALSAFRSKLRNERHY
ncbi:MAG: hypothetical protein NW215_11230 [Hyphomicrobiales bacterium]|nr:hypothetical protein [Hyphomicrobiales bacterium]